nr:hypothetical protein [uncultured bacterium]
MKTTAKKKASTWNGVSKAKTNGRVVLAPAVLDKKTAALPIPEQLDQAIEEARLFMHQSLAGEGSDDVPFRFRVAAEGFLVAAFNRFKLIAPVDAYHKFGYTRAEMGEIRSTIIDLQGVRTGRWHLDTLLQGLVYQAKELVESQTEMCQQCEHCRREHPELVDYEPGKDDPKPLTEAEFAHILRVMEDDCAEAEHWLLVLRHLEALAWAGRAVAVKDAVSELVDVLVDPKSHAVKLRENMEKKARAGLGDEMRRWAELDKARG